VAVNAPGGSGGDAAGAAEAGAKSEADLAKEALARQAAEAKAAADAKAEKDKAGGGGWFGFGAKKEVREQYLASTFGMETPHVVCAFNHHGQTAVLGARVFPRFSTFCSRPRCLSFCNDDNGAIVCHTCSLALARSLARCRLLQAKAEGGITGTGEEAGDDAPVPALPIGGAGVSHVATTPSGGSGGADAEPGAETPDAKAAAAAGTKVNAS
jgi:hypothetical protein